MGGGHCKERIITFEFSKATCSDVENGLPGWKVGDKNLWGGFCSRQGSGYISGSETPMFGDRWEVTFGFAKHCICTNAWLAFAPVKQWWLFSKWTLYNRLVFARNTRITETELTVLPSNIWFPCLFLLTLTWVRVWPRTNPKTLLMPYGIWCNTQIDFSLGLISVIFLNPKPQNYYSHAWKHFFPIISTEKLKGKRRSKVGSIFVLELQSNFGHLDD